MSNLSNGKAKSLRCFGDPYPAFPKITVVSYKIGKCESIQQMNNCLLPMNKKAPETVFGISSNHQGYIGGWYSQN